MKNQNDFQPFLFSFFLRLKKEAGIELDTEQYEAFLACWLETKTNDKSKIFHICEALWLSRKEFKPRFTKLFEEQFALFQKYSAPEHINLTNQTEKEDEPESPPADAEIAPFPAGGDEEKKDDEAEDDDKNPPRNPTNPGIPLQGVPLPEPIVDTSEWSELSLSIQDTSRNGHSLKADKRSSYSKSTFTLLPEKALPFTTRKVTQMWRKVPTYFIDKPTAKLDAPALIQQLVTDGVIHKPEYKTEKTENQQIVWLTDHDGSMNPFRAWEASLLQAITNNPGNRPIKDHATNFDRYYFHDCPIVNSDTNNFRLFSDTSHTKLVDWSKELNKHKWNKHTQVIIFSDAGAAHKKLDFGLIRQMHELCKIIRQTTSRILWINPVRKTDDSSAQYISYFVTMIYPDDASIKRFTSGLPPLGYVNEKVYIFGFNDLKSYDDWEMTLLPGYESLSSLNQAQIEGFCQVCPTDAHWWMLCHAAFPVALTTDLLQQIWWNFQADETGKTYPIPLHTVDELLHSPIVREIGRDLYEISLPVREVLLRYLRGKDNVNGASSILWGPVREWRLAAFMGLYLKERRNHVPTGALAAAEKINYQKQTLTSSELTEEINSLLTTSQTSTNPAQRLEALSQIEYLLSTIPSESNAEKGAHNFDSIQALKKLVDSINLAKKGSPNAVESFKEAQSRIGVNPSQQGYKVKLPREVQEVLLRNTTRDLINHESSIVPVVLSYFLSGSEDNLTYSYVVQEYNTLLLVWDEHNLDSNNYFKVDHRARRSPQLNDIREDISLFGDRTVLLHFTGFIPENTFFTNDSYSDGLADILVDLPNLKLVFFDGGIADHIVSRLVERGIKVVIESRSGALNKEGFDFARHFYRKLTATGNTIQESFQYALAKLQLTRTNSTGLDSDLDESMWKLSANPRYETLLHDPDWHVITKEQEKPKHLEVPKLYCVLVGISNYDKARKISASLHTDLELVEKHLLSLADFEVHLTKLTDHEATKDKIVRTFRNTLGQAHSEDTVLFWFSGHDAMEEADTIWGEADGLLDCLVCYDGGTNKPADYLITHKEIHLLLNELYSATRAHIVTIYDCKYQGDGKLKNDVPDSSLNTNRSSAFPMRDWNDFIFSDSVSRTDIINKRSGYLSETGTYFQISASERTKPVTEVTKGGGFIKSFVKALGDQKETISYALLINRIQQYMRGRHNGQSPRLFIAGNNKDSKQIGFLNKPTPKTRRPQETIFNPDLGWLLNLGVLHGVNKHSKITLTDPLAANDTYFARPKEQEIYADYTVLDVQGIHAETAYQADVRNLSTGKLKLFLENHDATIEECDDLLAALTDTSNIEFVDSDCNYKFHIRCAKVYITSPSDKYRPLIVPMPYNTKEDVQKLKETFQQIARWHYVKNLKDGLQVRQSLISTELFELNSDGSKSAIDISNRLARPVFRKNETKCELNLVVKITNISEQDLYVAALYLSNLFGITPRLTPMQPQLLLSGESMVLSYQQNHFIRLESIGLEQIYNFASINESIKFIVSDQLFETNGFSIDNLENLEKLENPVTR
ncbi:caspase family protein [Dyadobacter sp. CY261]|uniref:caspase family protein n=1 Tax=Dyadobacter sp. CY261 TaxID=2907203 RepID=UPI001F2B131F|nr:caspase family protein [Dyadobacter sp. CY261]MCF0072924.1 caspase family protein [Dyadobacter sp. CY261]